MKNREITSSLLLLHRKVSKYLKKQEVFRKLVRIIRSLVRCDDCAIIFIEGKDISVVADGIFKKEMSSTEWSQSIKPVRYILKTGKSIITGDIAKSKFKPCLPVNRSINSLLYVPVKINGKVSGIIQIDSRKKNAFTEDDLNFTRLISSELSSILERSILYSKVEELSIKDQLTGCFNYRSLYFDLKKEIERCRRYKKNFSVIMMDIDNFKKYNDTFGHQKGDKLLKKVAEAIRQKCRKSDILYRYGGDEFVLLLPETSGEGAGICAGRIEKTIDSMNRKIDKNTKITISTGTASFPEDASSPVYLMRVADKAMYGNKLNKKNAA